MTDEERKRKLQEIRRQTPFGKNVVPPKKGEEDDDYTSYSHSDDEDDKR